MKLASGNLGNLSMVQMGSMIAFDPIDNDLVLVRITEERLIGVADAGGAGVTAQVQSYGWVSVIPGPTGYTLGDEAVYGSGVVKDIIPLGTESTFVVDNPIFSEGLNIGQNVYIRRRGLFSFTYSETRGAVQASTLVGEVVSGGGGSASGVKSVQCVNNILLVTY